MKLSKKDKLEKTAARRDLGMIQGELALLTTRNKIQNYMGWLALSWSYIEHPVKSRIPVEKPDWLDAAALAETRNKAISKNHIPLTIADYTNTQAKSSYDRKLAGDPEWYLVK